MNEGHQLTIAGATCRTRNAGRPRRGSPAVAKVRIREHPRSASKRPTSGKDRRHAVPDVKVCAAQQAVNVASP